jgi:hypothetical protein
MVLAPKFSKSFTLTFIYCLCLFALGNIVSEPFSEDFQDQDFDESQFFFVEQQGKLS